MQQFNKYEEIKKGPHLKRERPFNLKKRII